MLLSSKVKVSSLVADEYLLVNKVGTGAFGEIYHAVNVRTGREVAIKCENITASPYSQLHVEYRVYNDLHTALQSTCNKPSIAMNKQLLGIPKVYSLTSEGLMHYMVMEELGSSIESLFIKTRRYFSLKTVLQIGYQALNLLEFVHSQGYIHRDVKGDNFLMGTKEGRDILYIIDFGLAKRFQQPNGEHIPFQTGKGLNGTVRYSSVNAQLGFELSRRDDLESLGYMLIYLLKGKLPWSKAKGESRKEKYAKILEIKASTPFSALCFGLPNEFITYFEYIRQLKFTEKPDYAMIRGLFHQIMQDYQFQIDYIYDWTPVEVLFKPFNMTSLSTEHRDKSEKHPPSKSTPATNDPKAVENPAETPAEVVNNGFDTAKMHQNTLEIAREQPDIEESEWLSCMEDTALVPGAELVTSPRRLVALESTRTLSKLAPKVLDDEYW